MRDCVDTPILRIKSCEFHSPVFGLCVYSEPPKVEEPEKWEELQLSSLELFIQTHNKNPVERVSLKI